MIDGAKVLAVLVSGVLTDNLVFLRFFAEQAALASADSPPRRFLAAWWR
jgi:hypothetical protein